MAIDPTNPSAASFTGNAHSAPVEKADKRPRSAASFPESVHFTASGKTRRFSYPLTASSYGKKPQLLQSSEEEKTLSYAKNLRKDFDAFAREFEKQNEDFSNYIDGLMEEFEQIASEEDKPSQPKQALDRQIDHLQASVNQLQSKLKEIQEGIETTASLINAQPKASKPPLASKKPPTAFETAVKIAAIALPILVGGAAIAGAFFFLGNSR